MKSCLQQILNYLDLFVNSANILHEDILFICVKKHCACLSPNLISRISSSNLCFMLFFWISFDLYIFSRLVLCKLVLLTRLTLACRLPVRPLLNLHIVPGPSDEVLVLEGGVVRDVERIPGLRQSDLWAVLGLLVNLEHHHALVQVDVLKKPGADGENERGGGFKATGLNIVGNRTITRILEMLWSCVHVLWGRFWGLSGSLRL